jgi:hypothetical protein
MSDDLRDGALPPEWQIWRTADGKVVLQVPLQETFRSQLFWWLRALCGFVLIGWLVALGQQGRVPSWAPVLAIVLLVLAELAGRVLWLQRFRTYLQAAPNELSLDSRQRGSQGIQRFTDSRLSVTGSPGSKRRLLVWRAGLQGEWVEVLSARSPAEVAAVASVLAKITGWPLEGS